MDLREHMEHLVKIGGNACTSRLDCCDCPFDLDALKNCRDRGNRVFLAKKWLDDHPVAPVAPVSITKSATVNGTTTSVSFTDGRISLYRCHGNDYESVGFGGTLDDYKRFDDGKPGEWVKVAMDMVSNSK